MAPSAKDALTTCKINGKSYPVLFDTGAVQIPEITAAHIKENSLPSVPISLSDKDGTAHTVVLSLIDRLQLGDLTIHNMPAVCSFRHTEYRLFGLPIYPLAQASPYLASDYAEIQIHRFRLHRPTDGVFRPCGFCT
jgi:hypothetical protein